MAESGLLQPGLTQLLGVCVSPYGELALRSFDELRGALDQFRRELAEAPRFSVGSASTVGNYIFRRNNQDACGHIVLESTCGSVNEGGGFFCVADGIGGIDDGARASQIAVQSACRAFSRAWNHYGGAELERRPGDFARAIVKVASQRLALEGEFDASQNRGGTTFTGLLIAGRRAGLGHVGDSRAVLVRRARSIQMSRDHTLANIFADLGEEADSEANKRTLSRFLSTGMELESARVDGLCRQAAAELSAPDPDSAGFRVEQGDLFVLTSDGVHDQIDGALFEQTLRLHRSDPRLLANALVQQTLSEVGRDNATAQVVLVS